MTEMHDSHDELQGVFCPVSGQLTRTNKHDLPNMTGLSRTTVVQGDFCSAALCLQQLVHGAKSKSAVVSWVMSLFFQGLTSGVARRGVNSLTQIQIAPGWEDDSFAHHVAPSFHS